MVYCRISINIIQRITLLAFVLLCELGRIGSSRKKIGQVGVPTRTRVYANLVTQQTSKKERKKRRRKRKNVSHRNNSSKAGMLATTTRKIGDDQKTTSLRSTILHTVSRRPKMAIRTIIRTATASVAKATIRHNIRSSEKGTRPRRLCS